MGKLVRASANRTGNLQCEDVTKIALYLIVVDEIDAVFLKRTAAEEIGEGTGALVVNQVLAKMDGATVIPNFIVTRMTNRRDFLDEALLRPGQLEFSSD